MLLIRPRRPAIHVLDDSCVHLPSKVDMEKWVHLFGFKNGVGKHVWTGGQQGLQSGCFTAGQAESQLDAQFFKQPSELDVRVITLRHVRSIARICMMMTHTDAKKLERGRGYADLDPELAWSQWQILRASRD